MTKASCFCLVRPYVCPLICALLTHFSLHSAGNNWHKYSSTEFEELEGFHNHMSNVIVCDISLVARGILMKLDTNIFIQMWNIEMAVRSKVKVIETRYSMATVSTACLPSCHAVYLLVCAWLYLQKANKIMTMMIVNGIYPWLIQEIQWHCCFS